MTESRGAKLSLAVALLVVVLGNLAAGLLFSRGHEVEAASRPVDRAGSAAASASQTTDPSPSHAFSPASADGPLLLVVGASYGRRGIQTGEYDRVLHDGEPRTIRWWCDGTTPVTWNQVLRRDGLIPPTVTRVVLLVSPYGIRYPSSHKDLALRHLIPIRELGDVLATGQLQDAAEMLIAGISPVHRSRRGGRELLLTAMLNPIGLDKASRMEPPHSNPWWEYSPDNLELAGLRQLCAWLAETGREPILAEWPTSSSLDPSYHQLVDSHFRPAIAAIARESGAQWIPAPSPPLWRFGDPVHPSTAQGVEISGRIARAIQSNAGRTAPEGK